MTVNFLAALLRPGHAGRSRASDSGAAQSGLERTMLWGDWSGYRESNPGIQLGRLLLYH